MKVATGGGLPPAAVFRHAGDDAHRVEKNITAARLAAMLQNGNPDDLTGTYTVREVKSILMPHFVVTQATGIKKGDVLLWGIEVLSHYGEARDDVQGWIHTHAAHPDLYNLGVCVDEWVEMFKTLYSHKAFQGGQHEQ